MFKLNIGEVIASKIKNDDRAFCENLRTLGFSIFSEVSYTVSEEKSMTDLLKFDVVFSDEEKVDSSLFFLAHVANGVEVLKFFLESQLPSEMAKLNNRKRDELVFKAAEQALNASMSSNRADSLILSWEALAMHTKAFRDSSLVGREALAGLAIKRACVYDCGAKLIAELSARGLILNRDMEREIQKPSFVEDALSSDHSDKMLVFIMGSVSHDLSLDFQRRMVDFFRDSNKDQRFKIFRLVKNLKEIKDSGGPSIELNDEDLVFINNSLECLVDDEKSIVVDWTLQNNWGGETKKVKPKARDRF